MFRSAFSGRRLLAGALMMAAPFGVAAPAQAVQSKALTYRCKYPLIGTNPVSVKFTLDTPNTPAGQPSAPFAISVEVSSAGNTSAGLPLIEGLTSLEGQANVTTSVTPPGGAPVSVKIPVDIPRYTLPTPIPDPLVLNGSGLTPALTLDGGQSTIRIEQFSLRLIARDAAGVPIILPPLTKDIDGNPVDPIDDPVDWFDVICKLDAGQDTTIPPAHICLPVITPYDPPTAVPLSDADVTDTSVHLRWGASPAVPCGTAPTDYRITYGDQTITVPAFYTDRVITGLTPNTPYVFKVEAIIGGGLASRPLTVNVTTDADPVAPEITSAFDVAGAAQLQTLVKGTVPLKGGLVMNVRRSSGLVVGGSLSLAPTQARLIGLGFLPVTAKLAFVSSGSLSGSLRAFAGEYLSQNVRIKVLEAKLFGAIPLAGGNNCQTKSLTTLMLNSTSFTTAGGGQFSGKFAISDLNGCGALNGLVSPLAAGGGNTISLNLTPKA